ncbi:DUF3211 domain-containing protein [Acidianus brierleyi]|uniref:DUF3211 domain-containing protein n=1 Tax=Acidianus brierleyi TaxID=41673 RepID=A0A2U9IHZ0_9CREN|nr:DUF3211 domain-containing protein [Acidianus brierleyi]AWR95649.1 DUF3211 domain-containing protein [Acidianus brierleyi]
MLVEKDVRISHEWNAIIEILSDPYFTLPRLFPPIKKVNRNGESFECEGKFVGMRFTMRGNIYRSTDLITFIFSLRAGGGLGNGKLMINSESEVLKLIFSYEGWMNRFSKTFFMSKWFDNFAKNLNEEIRLERIRRKI